MRLFVLAILLCLLAGVAHAGTFELKDPAAEMQEDQQAMADKLAELEARRSTRCTVDADTGECACFEKETGAKLVMTNDECAKLAEELSGSSKD